MKHPRGSVVIVALAVVLAFTGCQFVFASEEEKMGELAAAVMHVSAAVHAYVRYSNVPETLTGEELIVEATRENRALLQPFADYYLTARRVGKLSAVLVCDRERIRALLEDTGCTTVKFDGPRWRESPPATCSFVLNLDIVCAGH